LSRLIVVADAGPIIHLSRVGHIDLLPAIYGRLLIPNPVYHEVVEAGKGLAGSAELEEASWADFVPHDPASEMFARLTPRLGAGEAAALCLSADRDADLILSDDGEARALARKMGFQVIGTLGILAEGKRRGELSHLAPLLRDLKAKGTWLSEALIERVLRAAGEIDSRAM
jgi:predicted nucleic acid-binding protein